MHKMEMKRMYCAEEYQGFGAKEISPPVFYAGNGNAGDSSHLSDSTEQEERNERVRPPMCGKIYPYLPDLGKALLIRIGFGLATHTQWQARYPRPVSSLVCPHLPPRSCTRQCNRPQGHRPR